MSVQYSDNVPGSEYYMLSPRGDSRSTSLGRRPYWRRLLRCEKPACFRFTSFGILLLTITLAILGILFYPQVPEYSICNKSIQWSSILEALITYDMKVDLEVQTSVYNPNRFDLTVPKLTLHLLHNGNKVATAKARDIVLPAGSVTDVVVLASVAPTMSDAVSMASDYARGKLFLDADIHFETTVAFWNTKLLNYNASINYEDIDVNGDPDRKLCKCQGEQ